MSPSQYSDYKDSGAQWLGPVPAGWSVVPLWSLFRRSKQLGNGSEELLSVYRDHGVIPKSSRDDNKNKASEDLTKYQIVEIGDLVINKMKAWQGSVAVSEHHGIVSPAYFVFKHLDIMNLRFMHYLMRSVPYSQHYASISSGVRPNQWDLDPARHRVMPVLFPPLDEQQAIVNYLDYEMAEIDAFIADQEELIALLKERRAAAISASTFPDSEAQSGRPTGVRIGQVFQESDVRAGIATASELLSVSIHFGVRPWHELHDKEPKASDLGNYKVVRPGDIVLNRMRAFQGGLGESKAHGVVSPDYMVMRIRENADSKFIAYLMKSHRFISEMSARLRGIGSEEHGAVRTPRINPRDLASIVVPLPAQAEQKSIAAYLDSELAEIDDAIADAREAISLSKERRTAVISAAVTGKIDVRERAMTEQAIIRGEPVGVA